MFMKPSKSQNFNQNRPSLKGTSWKHLFQVEIFALITFFNFKNPKHEILKMANCTHFYKTFKIAKFQSKKTELEVKE